MPRVQLPAVASKRRAWNKGRIIGQKRPLLPKQVWAIRARLELAGNLRDLTLFNVAIDSKLRGCDLVKLAVTDLVRHDRVRERVSVIQSQTKRPVQFELSENTRDTIAAWIKSPEMVGCRFIFPSRFHDRPHISTRQYGRLVRDRVAAIGLEPSGYGTHSLRRTKAAEIYRKTGNLRAVQLLLGQSKVDSTVRYLGVELEDALSIAEHIDIRTMLAGGTCRSPIQIGPMGAAQQWYRLSPNYPDIALRRMSCSQTAARCAPLLVRDDDRYAVRYRREAV